MLKTVEVPQLQYLQGGRFPYCCSSSTRCGRPCECVATQSRSQRCHRSVHRLIWWTSQFAQRQVSQLGAMMGFFDAFCVIFRAPPVVPELSASLRSWGALDDEEFFVIEGSGVALTPGVSLRCQATSRCQLMLSVCGQTHPSECRLQNNNNQHNNHKQPQQPQATTNKQKQQHPPPWLTPCRGSRGAQ